MLVGRIEKGSLEIIDLSAGDQWSPRVNGIPRGKPVSGCAARTSRFYVPGRPVPARRAKGTGISISARGTARSSLDGDPDAVGDTGDGHAIGDDRPAPTVAGRRDEGLRSVHQPSSASRRPDPSRFSHDRAADVLVVEDETSIASFVALYLKNAGYGVQGRRRRAAPR